MVISIAIISQCTITLTLCINFSWCHLLCLHAFRYVYPPPLSEANCPPFPPPGRPGPPATKMAPFSPGSTHTLSTLFVTHTTVNFILYFTLCYPGMILNIVEKI